MLRKLCRVSITTHLAYWKYAHHVVLREAQIDAKPTRAGSGSRAKQDFWGALVLLNADGQSFDTVMAAINSSKCASCDVTLIVERKKRAPNKVSYSICSKLSASLQVKTCRLYSFFQNNTLCMFG